MKQVLFAPTGICIQHHGSYTIPNYTIAFLWLYRAILQFFFALLNMIGVTLCSDTGICGHWQDGCAECDNNYKQSKDSFLSDENFKTKDWIKNIEIVRYNTKKIYFI